VYSVTRPLIAVVGVDQAVLGLVVVGDVAERAAVALDDFLCAVANAVEGVGGGGGGDAAAGVGDGAADQAVVLVDGVVRGLGARAVAADFLLAVAIRVKAELDAQCFQRLRDITRLDIAALRR
jgi:hypothetical protein